MIVMGADGNRYEVESLNDVGENWIKGKLIDSPKIEKLSMGDLILLFHYKDVIISTSKSVDEAKKRMDAVWNELSNRIENIF